MAKPPRPPGPAPDRAALHEAALRHLARFSATEAGLVRVLDRRIQRWARQAEADGQPVSTVASREAARVVAGALVQAGMIDDAGYAAARAARLVRAGRSRRATAVHLAAKGVQADVATAALPAQEAELPASLVFARKRRIGPFRLEPTAETRLRDLAAFARAGFPREIAEQAFGMTPEDAAEMIIALKRG